MNTRFMTKLVSLQPKMPPGPPRQCFPPLRSYPKRCCSHAGLPRNQLSSLEPAQLQAVLTKQCFPDYVLRSDFAHSGTTLPLSLCTAWQQPLKPHKNLEWVTEGRMSRRTLLQPTLMPYRTRVWGGTAPSLQLSRQSPPGFFQDCLLGTPGHLFQILQAPEGARDSHPQSM